MYRYIIIDTRNVIQCFYNYRAAITHLFVKNGTQSKNTKYKIRISICKYRYADYEMTTLFVLVKSDFVLHFK